jgi:hypothetical protein|tara:strand:- start:437 stop:838 length:402 start_codon:yes stop_codon:yes gene_type:complete
MYSKEEVYLQSLNDNNASISLTEGVNTVINYGVKIQRFSSGIEFLNCGRGGDYFQECNEEEYDLFYQYGWREGAIRLSMMNCKRKLDIVERKIRSEINTRKNDKHIQRLKSSRENLLVKYSRRNKQLKLIKIQ